MKHILRSLFLSFCTISVLFAQNKLTNSPQSGYYSYIYKLTDKEAFNIASSGRQVINDGFLHTLVDSFYTARPYLKKLPYGNYLQVRVLKNQFDYKLLAENNVMLQFINNKQDFQFTISDLKGNQVTDAQVTLGKNKTIRYYKEARLYVAGSAQKPAVITVRYNGISNFFTYEAEKAYQPYKPAKKQARNKHLTSVPKRGGTAELKKKKYAGYMVFNKPMYKPLDTVKFKAYLVTAKGRPINDRPFRAVINKGAKSDEVVLATLKPYREGGYTYSFVLSDSLQLKLDRNYNVALQEQVKKDWVTVYSSSFRYEDYELKLVNFTVRTDKEEQNPGSPVSIFMKAADENDLAVPDGRVELVVLANNVSKYYDQRVFVKDTLWKTSLMLDAVGETKLVLPDSIFPKADLFLSLQFTFLNSNNERRSAYKSLKYVLKEQEIKADFKKDSLYLDYLVKGESIKQLAAILISYPNSNDKDSLQIELPAAIKINYKAGDYRIKMADGFFDHVFMESLKPEISVAAQQIKDSLRVTVSNPHKIPFWYTIFSGNKVLKKGYVTFLDTVIGHTSQKAAYVKLNYLWDETERSTEASAFFAANRLNVKLLAPDLVYPGQTVNMQVNVTDANNRPVPATDVTAYAYTSKFKNDYGIGLPNFGKTFKACLLLL